MLITMVFAVVGGAVSGLIMKWVAHFQHLYKTGSTVARLALNVGNVVTFHTDNTNLPKEMLFDDNAYFYQESDDEEKEYKDFKLSKEFKA